ncbi:hypothetical protein D3C78_723880 [compost metagenome]
MVIDSPQLVNPPPPNLLPPPAASAQVAELPPTTVSAKVEQPTPSGVWRVAGYIRKGKQGSDSTDSTRWKSNAGYGRSADAGERFVMDDQAILVSMSGVRYYPLSGCKAYEDGINYYCDIDGERVTPWSGKLALTNTFQSTAGASAQPSTERGERSDPRPVKDERQAVPVEPLKAADTTSGNLTIVADSEYASRPWRAQ